MLTNFLYVLLMIFGFGVIIAIHELGHFLAARWAGVRVDAFAIGFGSAIFSWRKGLGFRRGSGEAEYRRILASDRASSPELRAISPTEYRLNWFPFGGYVKMLGQEDLAPIRASIEKDHYAAKPVWKRMVIISAGVVMNLLLAACLFLIAFKIGIREVAPIAGGAVPGSPAAQAGIKPDDRILSAGGWTVETFSDLMIAVAMASKNEPLDVVVQRPGEPAPRTLAIVPERGSANLLQIGVYPASSSELISERDLDTEIARADFVKLLQQAGLEGVKPGMKLLSINGEPLPTEDGIATSTALRRAVESSEGRAIAVGFADDTGAVVETTIQPRPVLQNSTTKIGDDTFAFRHLLGLTPVMRIDRTEPAAEKQGLRAGDTVIRVGAIDWPSVPAGIAEVRKHAGREIKMSIIRDGSPIELAPRVNSEGRIGFIATDTASDATLLAATPVAGDSGVATENSNPLPASRIIPVILPGSRVVEVADVPVTNFAEMRAALRQAVQAVQDATGDAAALSIPITLELPPVGDAAARGRETIQLPLTTSEIEALRALGWEADAVLACFTDATFIDRAAGPWHALEKGIRKTRNVVVMTYVTFLRLFQGSVPVSQIQGPVGITHLGSRVAARGFVYFLFFLGLISANLAVVNFLPLPITDGGHMVFLAIEGITRRPVSVAVQNVATLAGLVLIGTVFVVVTFNDIVRLIG